jgi:4'-phosphopantetheinyl transferase
MNDKVPQERDALRNESISYFLESSVRDLTPTDSHRDIAVLFMPAQHDGPPADVFSSILSVSELSRAERFKGIDQKMSFLQRRAFRRFCGAIALGDARPLSQVGFATTREGRPYLSELPRAWFSFSSCRLGYLAAWSYSSAVGVDIESVDQAVSPVEMASYHFAPNESDAVCMAEVNERKRLFLRLWTLKEAGLKSIGEGISYGLDAFRFETTPGVRASFAPAKFGGPNNFNARSLEIAGCCAALVIRNRLLS